MVIKVDIWRNFGHILQKIAYNYGFIQGLTDSVDISCPIQTGREPLMVVSNGTEHQLGLWLFIITVEWTCRLFVCQGHGSVRLENDRRSLASDKTKTCHVSYSKGMCWQYVCMNWIVQIKIVRVRIRKRSSKVVLRKIKGEPDWNFALFCKGWETDEKHRQTEQHETKCDVY